MDIKKSIATNITKYRKAIGMSQKELANTLNVNPSRVSNWETGLNMMDIDMLFKICDVLNVSINDIYGIYPTANMELNYDEQSLINDFRQLNDEGQDKLREVLNVMIKSNLYIKTNIPVMVGV